MFAFALYDTRTRRLLLARDRVGIKPLYWALISGGLLFASEQKALLTSGLVSHRVNPIAIHDYLAQGYPITPATCWADIQMLEPGTWLELVLMAYRQDAIGNGALMRMTRSASMRLQTKRNALCWTRCGVIFCRTSPWERFYQGDSTHRS